MWELLIIAAGDPGTTIPVGKYKTEQICRIEQKSLSKAFGEAMALMIPEPDEQGFTFSPGLNCKKVDNR